MLQSFCENAHDLPGNSASTKRTIPLVYDYAKWPLQHPIFTLGRSLSGGRWHRRPPPGTRDPHRPIYGAGTCLCTNTKRWATKTRAKTP